LYRLLNRALSFAAAALFALIAPLRELLSARADRKLAVEIDLTLADQGVALGLAGFVVEGLAQTEALLDFARDNALARLTIDGGYGPETVWEPEPVTITLGGTPVGLPPGAFLQATADGEAALVDAAREWLGGAATVADLFAGLGTFAFALAGPGRANKLSHLPLLKWRGWSISVATRQAGRAMLPP